MCTLDFKDAYLSVATVQEHRRFIWNSKIYEFTPFGLCSAPHKASIPSRGILVEARSAINHLPGQPTDSREGLLQQVELTTQLLEAFTMNKAKSQLSPSQLPVLGISSRR